MNELKWLESSGPGYRIHEVAHVSGGGIARTLRKLSGTETDVYWSAEARQYDGRGARLQVDGICASLDEARAKAVEGAKWAATALKATLS